MANPLFRLRAAATLLAAMFLSLVALPAQAAVTITFWSHELGNSFPHAFFTLRGKPDGGPGADAAPVNLNYGFTPVTISPKILFGIVPGRLDIAKPSYMRGSDAQFALVLTDAQYAAVLKLVEEWGPKGDQRYHMNTRNCVHFTQEAARRSGLTNIDFPALMKRPRSYLKAVAAANAGRVTVIDKHGSEYLKTLDAAVVPAG